MEGLIRELHQELYSMSVGYLYYRSRKAVEEVTGVLPKIREFAEWFLSGNQFGIGAEDYRGLSATLLGILEDIADAIPRKDRVLLHDAAAYGLMGFLELFLEGEKEDGAEGDLPAES